MNIELIGGPLDGARVLVDLATFNRGEYLVVVGADLHVSDALDGPSLTPAPLATITYHRSHHDRFKWVLTS